MAQELCLLVMVKGPGLGSNRDLFIALSHFRFSTKLLEALFTKLNLSLDS